MLPVAYPNRAIAGWRSSITSKPVDSDPCGDYSAEQSTGGDGAGFSARPRMAARYRDRVPSEIVRLDDEQWRSR